MFLISFTGKHLCIAGCNFIKKILWHSCFPVPVNFAILLKNLSTEHLRVILLVVECCLWKQPSKSVLNTSVSHWPYIKKKSNSNPLSFDYEVFNNKWVYLCCRPWHLLKKLFAKETYKTIKRNVSLQRRGSVSPQQIFRKFIQE